MLSLSRSLPPSFSRFRCLSLSLALSLSLSRSLTLSLRHTSCVPIRGRVLKEGGVRGGEGGGGREGRAMLDRSVALVPVDDVSLHEGGRKQGRGEGGTRSEVDP